MNRRPHIGPSRTGIKVDGYIQRERLPAAGQGLVTAGGDKNAGFA
jgi:hypothetical protein